MHIAITCIIYTLFIQTTQFCTSPVHKAYAQIDTHNMGVSTLENLINIARLDGTQPPD